MEKFILILCFFCLMVSSTAWPCVNSINRETDARDGESIQGVITGIIRIIPAVDEVGLFEITVVDEKTKRAVCFLEEDTAICGMVRKGWGCKRAGHRNKFQGLEMDDYVRLTQKRTSSFNTFDPDRPYIVVSLPRL